MANKQAYTDFQTNNGIASEREMIRALAIQSMANTATAIASGTADVEGKPATTGLRLTGLSIGETAGATAVVTIRHGTANGDPAVLHISLAANAAQIITLPSGGIPMASGIWIDRESGTTEITLFTKTIV